MNDNDDLGPCWFEEDEPPTGDRYVDERNARHDQSEGYE